jgi:uncharacterized Zn-finger protein
MVLISGEIMSANSIPHFHNQPGVPRVRIGAKKFMCIGELPPFDHPHIFIDMGDDNAIVCPYCSTLFVYDPQLNGGCEPAECAFHDEGEVPAAHFAADLGVGDALASQAPSPPTRAEISGLGGGIVASFETQRELLRALEDLRSGNIGGVRTYTPTFVDEAPLRSPVPFVILIAGLLGGAGGFGMQVYANVVNYPLDIGGRPKFSWPSFVQIGFEIGVLCAVAAGFVSYLIVAGLPKLYDPIDETQSLREAMRDGWVVAIRPRNEQAMERALEILESLHPKLIEEIPA